MTKYGLFKELKPGIGNGPGFFRVPGPEFGFDSGFGFPDENKRLTKLGAKSGSQILNSGFRAGLDFGSEFRVPGRKPGIICIF